MLGGNSVFNGVVNVGTAVEGFYSYAGSTTFNALMSAKLLGLSGGNVAFNAAASFGTAESFMNSGTLNGSGNVTFNGLLSWTDGTMNGIGKIIVGSSGSITASSSTTKVSQRRFDNNGVVNVTGGYMNLYGGGTHTGPFSLNGGNLGLAQGHTFASTAPVIGSNGYLSVLSGDTVFSGLVNVGTAIEGKVYPTIRATPCKRFARAFWNKII